jgi:hypothetical protein
VTIVETQKARQSGKKPIRSHNTRRTPLFSIAGFTSKFTASGGFSATMLGLCIALHHLLTHRET